MHYNTIKTIYKGGETVLIPVVYNDFGVVKEKNYNYSVDMIRLTCQMSFDFFSRKIESRLCSFGADKWESSRLGEFNHNFKVSFDDCSFYVGYLSNAEKYCGSNSVGNPKSKFNLTIEFNPNKCKDNKLLINLLSLRYDDNISCPLDWSVVSCDFAYDF